jgi:predicted PurR-regulated permease PerM
MTMPVGTRPTPSSDREAARRRASVAWADLRGRLATVTPAAVGRTVLTIGVVGIALSLAAATWPTLLPFVIGGLVAYAVLPVVNALDRVLPRALAAGLTMLAAVAALVAAIVIIVPPLTGALLELSRQIPPADRLESTIQAALSGLPEDARAVVLPIATEIAGAARSALDSTSGNLGSIAPMVFQAALGVVGALLGLLVLPAWLLTVLTDQRKAYRAVDRRFAGWLRADAWAVIRMFDRSAGTYLRGFVVIAILVGIGTYLGLSVSPRVGGPTFPGALALSTLAGLVQLVPELGVVLGLVPALLLLFVDPERSAAYLASYIAARVLAGWLVGGRRVRSEVRVHPAILIPGVVVLGQIGFVLLLLSAPILSFGSDLVRYLHGRMSEPPRPAGLLPGEPLPATAAATRAARAAVVPPVYRQRRPGPPPLTTPEGPVVGATTAATPTAPAAR